MATVSRSGSRTAGLKLPGTRVIRPPYFTVLIRRTHEACSGTDPKGGVHMHWLLAHCAVFKERDALVPSSHRLRSFSVLSCAAIGFRTPTREISRPRFRAWPNFAMSRRTDSVSDAAERKPTLRRSPVSSPLAEPVGPPSRHGPPPTGCNGTCPGGHLQPRESRRRPSPRANSSPQPGEAALADPQDLAPQLAAG